MKKLPRLNSPVEDLKWTWDRQADQSELLELSSQSTTIEQLTCPVQKSPAWPLQFLEIWWDQTCGMCARTLNKRYSTTVTKYISNLRLDFEIESIFVLELWCRQPGVVRRQVVESIDLAEWYPVILATYEVLTLALTMLMAVNHARFQKKGVSWTSFWE